MQLPMTEPVLTGTVPPYYVQLLFDYLDARGESAGAVLRRQPPDADAATGIPVTEWADMLARAAAHMDDERLGLHLGQTITPRHLGVLGHLTLACDHLAGALSRLDRYQRLICDYAPMQQRLVGDYIELSWDASYGRPGPLVDETGITALVAYCQHLIDPTALAENGHCANPRLVCFMNPAPADIRPYEQYFCCPVLFDQPQTRIQVGLDTMLLPLGGADAELAALMERQAEDRLAALPDTPRLIHDLRHAVARALHNGEPSLEDIAHGLCISARTLQRRLRESGSRYRDELADVRYQLATAYLRDPRLTVADVAQLLGYSEHSAFSRSFTRWSGQSPQRWRADDDGDTRRPHPGRRPS